MRCTTIVPALAPLMLAGCATPPAAPRIEAAAATRVEPAEAQTIVSVPTVVSTGGEGVAEKRR